MDRALSVLLLASVLSASVFAAETTVVGGEDQAGYFRHETAALANRCLSDIHSLDDWQRHRNEYRRQLQEMLGLWPMPERTDLKPVITGRLEQADFAVEKIYFQASPHLYVTANLYLPKNLKQPAPAILYVCGHGRVFTNGVSCGNKTFYQHHGAWFARNGYVCLLIDTLQLGEIEGIHHGTYRLGQWWWNSRGYTPAGVEAWFGIRALDYLCSRPEVDPQRIGMTGRSGGGSYTWTVAALDDRVKVAAPIAGMTDLENQVVDGAVEGHCDCMFFVNTYRWDFPQVAALLAPRPLLIGNSDKDNLFPLDGVLRLYFQTLRIYQLYDQTNNLGLLITDGPHADTQDLEVPVFRWFNRFLKNQQPLIEMAAKKFFSPIQLRVFDQIPADQINTKIQESFVPVALVAPLPAESAEHRRVEQQRLTMLREKVFAGWPTEGACPAPERISQAVHQDVACQAYLLESQPCMRLKLFVLEDKKVRKPRKIILHVLDAASWTNSPARPLWTGGALGECSVLRREMQSQKAALAFFAPRAVEPAPWMKDPKESTQVRRRYMLLGQTLDGMRVWDIRRAAQTLSSLPGLNKAPLWVQSRGQMGINAAYAALFESGIQHLDLADLPKSHGEGPDYLSVLKVWDIPQLLEQLQLEPGPEHDVYSTRGQ